MKKPVIILILTLAASAPALASNCSWRQLPTDVVFGNYSVFSTSLLTAVGSYQINCTPNTQATITFSVGQHATSYLPRNMASGSNLVPYNIYDDTAMTVVLGDGTGGSTVRQVFNSTTQTKTYSDSYYGKVTQGSDVPAGSYSDIVTMNVAWSGGSISATFNVTATVLSECTIAAAALGFGDYDPIVVNATAPLDARSSISVFCTKNTPAAITLSNGLNYLGTTRRMAGPNSSFLNYGFYTDSSRLTPWTTVSAASTSKLAPIALTVYGRVPGGQDPSVGGHSDTVQAAVNY